MFGLTPKEHTILKLIAQGLSNEEIAKKLYIQKSTFATHKKNIFQKMGLIGEAKSSVRVKAVLMYLKEVNKGN